MIDAVRCAKLALDRGMSGPLVAPSAYFMKTPPQQFTDDQARRMTEEFIGVTPDSSQQDELADGHHSDEQKLEGQPTIEGGNGQSVKT
jgi:hypothetical protein